MEVILIIGNVTHMLPHVPDLETIKAHPWHVYTAAKTSTHALTGKPQRELLFTGTRAECNDWCTRLGYTVVLDLPTQERTS